MFVLIAFYALVILLFAAWMGWNMQRKLDKFDWMFRRSAIWYSFGRRLIFWPLLLVFNPSTMIKPGFARKPGLFIDFAELARRRTCFMQAPPACGQQVTYRAGNVGFEKTNAIFILSTEVVEKMAQTISKDYQGLQGMHAAIRWASQRNDNIATPTEAPDLLINFDHIVEGLIEAGHGQVTCLACNKTYATSEVTRKSEFTGSWLWAHYKCPAQHRLLSREVAHFLFTRNDD
jgi:hypothetical protein